MDAENNNRIKLPTKEQLAKLSLPKIQWYASRCALRALSLLTAEKIKPDWLNEYLESVCIAALTGQALVTQSSEAAARAVVNANPYYVTTTDAIAASVANVIAVDASLASDVASIAVSRAIEELPSSAVNGGRRVVFVGSTFYRIHAASVVADYQLLTPSIRALCQRGQCH